MKKKTKIQGVMPEDTYEGGGGGVETKCKRYEKDVRLIIREDKKVG